jgi:hypothetical protein
MIVDRHREFAKAVVALAREHKMDSLKMDFRDAYTMEELPRRTYEGVTMSWASGRHGDKGQIHLETRAIEDIGEGE